MAQKSATVKALQRRLAIEQALERVRVRSLAMQSSDELSDVLSVLFQQFDLLGIAPKTAWLTLWNPEENTFTYRSTGTSGKRIQGQQTVDIGGMDIWKALYEKWKTDTSDSVEVLFYSKEDLGQLFSLLEETYSAMPEEERLTPEHFPEGGYSVQGHCKFGYIGYTHTQEPTEEERGILTRFATEFGRVYQRFLDIEKAEAQAREAQIEAALERVRARSMAMHSTEELLEVVVVLFRQLRDLDIRFIQAWISIWYLEEGYLDLWMSPIEGFGDRPIYHRRPSAQFENSTIQSWKKGERFSYLSLTGKQAVTEFLLGTDQILGSDYFERLQKKHRYERLEFVDANHKYGTVSMSWHEEVDKKDREILYRFSKVFEQTYTRFLDLQKAEAQAREAKIEAALERVRAQTMAMHTSNELLEVIQIIAEQLSHLGIRYNNVSLGPKVGQDELKFWIAGYQLPKPFIVEMPPFDHPLQNRVREAQHNGINFFQDSLTEAENRVWFEHLFKNNHLYFLSDEIKMLLLNSPGSVRSTFLLNSINFYIIRINNEPFTDEEHKVIGRFARVFEQAYTRFLDLKKAEQRTREAQIETALERVRARSMAMHRSEELGEVAAVLFQQLNELVGELWTCGFVLCEENRKEDEWWLSMDGGFTRGFFLPNVGDYTHATLYEGWVKGDDFRTVQLEGASLQEHYDWLMEIETAREIFEDMEASGIEKPEWQKLHAAYFSKGYLCIITRVPSREEEVFIRFAQVFDIAYTRFLDLKKAEAQAREAQIETALERVRARSMAMHNTSELQDVINTVYQQFLELKVDISGGAFIAINDDIGTELVCWGAGGSADYVQKVRLPFMDMPIYTELLEGIKKGPGFFTESFSKEEKQVFLTELFKNPPYNQAHSAQKKEVLSRPGGYTRSCAVSEHTSIFIINHHGRVFTVEVNDILRRMAKVFEQTYVRFLDLQRAEKQAREARIEAALERVRAKTMAMHNSQDVGDTVITLFQEVMKLGLDDSIRCGIGILEGYEGMETWSANSDKKGKVILKMGMLNMSIHPMLIGLRKAWQKGDKAYSYHFAGSDVTKYYTALNMEPEYPIYVDLNTLPDNQFANIFFFTEGILFAFTQTQLTQEARSVLERFASVFGQTYRRYMDLLKAEAQAREAEIQLSLERIRARTMAMQESAELTEVLSVIFQQLRTLGVDTVWTHLTLVHLEENAFTYRMTGRNGERIMAEEKISLDASEHWKHISDAVKSPDKDPDPITRFEIPPDGLDAIWELFDGIFSKLPEGEKVAPADFPNGLYTTQAYCKFGFLGLNQTREATREEADILLRFTTEFSRLYQRFLDLQNAEERAREAQIDTALERVRARSMAMHSTEELADVLCVLLEQFDLLGVHPVLTHLTLFDAENETFSLRITTSPENRIVSEQHIDVNAMEAWKESFNHWKNTESQAVDCIDYSPEMLPGLFGLMDELIKSLPKKYRIYPKDFPEGLFTTQGRFNAGFIGFNHTRRATEEEKEIVKRLAAEFGRVYQRFLDLEKAEAQAREAEIEAALERVRSRTMAMHKSVELGEVAAVLFQQIDSLGATLERLNIGIVREEDRVIEWWSTEQGGQQIDRLFKGNIDEPTTISKVYAAWKEGKKRLELDQSGDELKQWIRYVTEVIGMPFDPKLIQERRVHSAAFFKHGALLVSTPEPLPAESISLLERFAAVFEQTYTRFLDLQKAEQQAREAEIEAALERVRAKTMAMHNTDDIADTVVTFFEELLGLGLEDSMRAGIGILSQSEQMKVWTASVPGTTKTILHSGFLDMSSHPLLQGVKRTWSKGDPHFTYVLKGEDLKAYFQNLNEAPEYTAEFDLRKLPGTIHHRSIPFRDGVLFAFTEVPLPEDIISTLERFAAVFGQTYTRYLDLQKAEERARESRVEAALERVRAQALAMHSSQDLRQTITAIFEELKNLDVKTIRLGLGLLNPDESEGEIITSRIGDQGEIIEVNGTFRLEGHPVLEGVYAHFKKQEDYFPVLQGEEIVTYYASLQKSVDVQGLGTSSSHYGCFLYFPEGALYAWAASPHSDEQVGILKKFSRVVEITYRRYNDLIESEAREKEAVKQASLDRVRAEISSMRTASDLGRITPLIWNELTTLGVPFFRCGVFIVDEKEKKIHSYLSNPKGESLAAWQVSFGQIPVFDDMVKSWQKQEVFLIEWDRQGFLDFSQLLMEHGLVDDRERYQSGKDAPDHLVLHMMPFAQGMLYVGSKAHLETDQMELVQSLASAFSVAYARYEDFNQLEKTLADLKATQAQLIQSEKMASLGELTAGIAHEIKNPLNFVNNFSEVSRELLEELMEEMEKGDLEEVRALAGDVIQNLEKIVHHGQRADSIVKGMLQHSRSGDGQKEPTDINELADEYLRLAYHGMRAKDKSFNVTLTTDLDHGVGALDIIPQDIGRVLLNLITNAFHAVNEKAEQGLEGYQPEVSLQTKKTENTVEIRVSDNGNGIPEKIRAKIFQPFFTTKPTGEGTGLGLSLSYDIVKAHGGELTLDTQEGAGTTFYINLKTIS